MAKTGKLVSVNIPAAASGKGLRDDAAKEAAKRGLNIRPFVGRIYEYAVGHKKQFGGALNEARPKRGEHIGATVSPSVRGELNKWAESKHTSRGLLCCFILEKALQDKLLDKIFGSIQD